MRIVVAGLAASFAFAAMAATASAGGKGFVGGG